MSLLTSEWVENGWKVCTFPPCRTESSEEEQEAGTTVTSNQWIKKSLECRYSIQLSCHEAGFRYSGSLTSDFKRALSRGLALSLRYHPPVILQLKHGNTMKRRTPPPAESSMTRGMASQKANSTLIHHHGQRILTTTLGPLVPERAIASSILEKYCLVGGKALSAISRQTASSGRSAQAHMCEGGRARGRCVHFQCQHEKTCICRHMID